MPFFTPSNPETIRRWCTAQPLHELDNLNRRYGVFFEKAFDQISINNEELISIEESIYRISEEKKLHEQEIEHQARYRQQVLSNLPGNGAERYLILQSLSMPTHDESKDHHDELKLLQERKKHLTSQITYFKNEISSCKKELQIINQIKHEKQTENNEEKSIYYKLS